jgi:hypothetical protein
MHINSVPDNMQQFKDMKMYVISADFIVLGNEPKYQNIFAEHSFHPEKTKKLKINVRYCTLTAHSCSTYSMMMEV